MHRLANDSRGGYIVRPSWKMTEIEELHRSGLVQYLILRLPPVGQAGGTKGPKGSRDGAARRVNPPRAREQYGKEKQCEIA